MIIIPIKWLFHWEYTLFSDKPISDMAGFWHSRNFQWRLQWIGFLGKIYTRKTHRCFHEDHMGLFRGEHFPQQSNPMKHVVPLVEVVVSCADQVRKLGVFPGATGNEECFSSSGLKSAGKGWTMIYVRSG